MSLNTRPCINDLTPAQRAIASGIASRDKLSVSRLTIPAHWSQANSSFESGLAEKQPFIATVNFGNQETPVPLDVQLTMQGIGLPVHDIAVLKQADSDGDLELMYVHTLKLLYAADQMANGASGYYIKLRPCFGMSDNVFKFEVVINDEVIGIATSKHADIHVITAITSDEQRTTKRDVAQGIANVFQAIGKLQDDDTAPLPSSFRKGLELVEGKKRLVKKTGTDD